MTTFRRPASVGRNLAAATSLVALAAGCSLPTTTTAASSGSSARSPLTESLVDDVWSSSRTSAALNAAPLRGIPSSFDWAQKAVLRSWDRATYRAITPWGQISETGSAGSPVRNVRVQVRSLQAFWLIGGKWTKVTPPSGADGKVEGGYYSSSFTNAVPIQTRDDGSGVSSFSLEPIHDLNRPVAHFFWEGWYPRPTVPAGATAVHISVMMRLASDGTASALSKAKYIAAVSFDQDRTATDVPGGVKQSLGIPRHTLLSASWQRFGFTNLNAAQIATNPPPVRAS